jgi:hypothetical protein
MIKNRNKNFGLKVNRFRINEFLLLFSFETFVSVANSEKPELSREDEQAGLSVWSGVQVNIGASHRWVWEYG